MRITLAKTAGFCFGVDRAVNMAYEISEKGTDAATLGQLIHNTYVTSELESKGVRTIESPSEARKGETEAGNRKSFILFLIYIEQAFENTCFLSENRKNTKKKIDFLLRW